MPSVPDPANVKPWYLRNITEALALDEASGNVYVRTGITGDIIIEGNVNIPADINAHIVEVGGSGNLEQQGINYLPIGGNVVVTSGNINANVSGTVSVSSLPEVEIKNDTGHPIPISKDINVNSTTNRIYVSQETDVILADSNYEINVARGLVDGQFAVTRSALNPSVNQNIETSIWVEGGIYPFGTWTTAQQLFVVSSSVSDTGQTILIEGLDSSYNIQTDTITTNGTTGVLTTKSFIRIFTAIVTSASSSSANAGEILFRLGSISGTVVAHMGAGFGTTKLSQYTIPAGYTGYILYGDATTFRGGSGNIGSQVRMMIRPFNGSFLLAFVAEVVNGYYRNDFTIPLKVLEKTDIDVRIVADANNTVASCNYQLILIPNT